MNKNTWGSRSQTRWRAKRRALYRRSKSPSSFASRFIFDQIHVKTHRGERRRLDEKLNSQTRKKRISLPRRKIDCRGKWIKANWDYFGSEYWRDTGCSETGHNKFLLTENKNCFSRPERLFYLNSSSIMGAYYCFFALSLLGIKQGWVGQLKKHPVCIELCPYIQWQYVHTILSSHWPHLNGSRVTRLNLSPRRRKMFTILIAYHFCKLELAKLLYLPKREYFL